MNRLTSRIRRIGAIALVLGVFTVPGLALNAGSAHAAGDAPKAVYTSTNSATGNAVVVYNRSVDGALTSAGPNVSTGGDGTGHGLGSQGALILSASGSWLFVVNAGSNTISSFAVQPNGLSLVSQVNSDGVDPISLTSHGNVLYVLNAGSSSIAGFTVDSQGALSSSPIPNSFQSLNASAASPEQISFNPAGTVLVVTEKGSGQIDTYTVGRDGSATGPQTFATGAVGPYGFAFDPNGHAIVSDAGIGAASSYALSPSGALSVISSQVPDYHAAPCWLVVTNNGKYAYTANAHDGTISSYSIDPAGTLTLLNGLAAGPDGIPLLDLALSGNSHFLYGDDGGSKTIVAYSVGHDGSLTPVSGTAVVSGTGLAAQ